MTCPRTAFFQRARHMLTPRGTMPSLADFNDAYQVQKTLLKRGAHEICWKLGGVNIATREAFATDSVYAGPLAHDAIISAHKAVTIDAFGPNCQGELEVLVMLGDVDAYWNGDRTLDQLIVKVAPAIECPATMLDFPKNGLLALIADCCAAGTVIHGDWKSWKEFDSALSHAPVELIADGTVLATGYSTNLIGGIKQTIKDFMQLAKTQGLDVRSYDLVSTGGLTPCVNLPQAAHYQVNFPGLNNFSIDMIK